MVVTGTVDDVVTTFGPLLIVSLPIAGNATLVIGAAPRPGAKVFMPPKLGMDGLTVAGSSVGFCGDMPGFIGVVLTGNLVGPIGDGLNWLLEAVGETKI